MKLIPLTQGQFAMVDDEFFEELNIHKWCAYWAPNSKTFYASRNLPRVKGKGGKGRKVLMHRVITKAEKGSEVDHIDHNGLNNQLYNLRISTQYSNQWNVGINVNNTSRFKGVSWAAESKRWRARIRAPHRAPHEKISLGLFDFSIDAAEAYNKAALLYHGEFAYQNDLSTDWITAPKNPFQYVRVAGPDENPKSSL